MFSYLELSKKFKKGNRVLLSAFALLGFCFDLEACFNSTFAREVTHISETKTEALTKFSNSQSENNLSSMENCTKKVSKSLHILRWKNLSKRSKAVIVAVHGTTQHAGSFDSLAKILNNSGYIFIALDLRGHGERFYKGSGLQNKRVDYEKSADDLGLLLEKVKATYPDLPIFCLGESVGAGVTTLAATKYANLMDGVILCSPGTRPCVFNPFMVIPDFIKGITHLDVPMNVARYIDHYSSDDKRVSDEMIGDPLSRINLTPKEILRTAFFIRRTPNTAKTVDANIPILIVQGEKDRIVSTSSTKAILKNLHVDNKKLVEFKKAGHVLLGTSYLKPEVISSINSWLNEQTSTMNMSISKNRTKVIGKVINSNKSESSNF